LKKKDEQSEVGVDVLVVPECICASLVRDDEALEITRGILTKHHPRCSKFEGKKKYFRITRIGAGTYIQPISELHHAFDGELDGAEIGAKWTLELIEMYQEEYDALPEFAGH
jgi:hypothetical protein